MLQTMWGLIDDFFVQPPSELCWKPDILAFSFRWRWICGLILSVISSTVIIWSNTEHGAWYVRWDPTYSSVIVAQQGMNPTSL